MNLGFPRALRFGALCLVAALSVGLAACGGGGGDGGGGSAATNGGSGSNTTASLPAPPSEQPIAATAANTVPVTVGTGLAGAPNIPTVSVTVCVPNTTTCQTVDNIQVDTASFGLRILSSALSTVGGSLPGATVSGGSLAECMTFADSYTWGSVRNADVKIGGETASNIPVQVIGDITSAPAPAACTHVGVADNTPHDLGANGILGIGVAPWDCGAGCANNVSGNYYYACSGSSCANTPVATAQQVANPIARFATDNNGAIVQMQPISYDGAPSAGGTLVFGINTESNNALNASENFATTAWGDLSSTFNGQSLTAFLDSGSNALFFNDSSLPLCSGNESRFYCPPASQYLSATLTGTNGASGGASFAVANASTLFASGNYAFNDLAGQFGSSSDLDLGLPFFYGRYVYVGQDTTARGGTQAPFVAF